MHAITHHARMLGHLPLCCRTTAQLQQRGLPGWYKSPTAAAADRATGTSEGQQPGGGGGGAGSSSGEGRLMSDGVGEGWVMSDEGGEAVS